MREFSPKDVSDVRQSSLFDEAWYLKRYPEVKFLGIDPIEHYLSIGSAIKREPSPQFCGTSYLDANPDVVRAQLNPLLHYIRSGKGEGRPAYPVLSAHEKVARAKAKRILTRRNVTWDGTKETDWLAQLNQYYPEAASIKVSIILPTKNRAFCISNAISSVRSQTHQEFELIIVDDGGSDCTAEVVSSYDDTRIIYLKLEESVGVSAARNHGLQIASGQWLFFLDSDNTWRPGFVETMLKFCIGNQLSAAYSAARLMDDKGSTKSILFADFDYESCLAENFIDLNSFCLSSSLRDVRFNEGIRRLVDWDYILRVGAHSRIKGIPYVGVDYYDGDKADRISKNEYSAQAEIAELVNFVRNGAKTYVQTADTVMDISRYRIAVVLHIFHKDRVSECITYLNNIDFEFDLFISTSLTADDTAVAEIRQAFPSSTLYFFPNLGSDIAPFMEILSTLKNYYLVCKIHTKRDVGKWGDLWRSALLQSTLGSTRHINEIVRNFVSNDNLTMVGSRDFYKSGKRNSISQTLDHVQILAGEIGLGEHVDKDWAFLAGTMFWVRPSALLRIARHMCDSAGYSVVFKKDGGIEHGLERLLGLALWEKPSNEVGLVTITDDGKHVIDTFPLGSGHVDDGVAATLNKMHERLIKRQTKA